VSDPIADFSRLGGTLGHLHKTAGDPELAFKATLHSHQQQEGEHTLPLDVVCIDAAVLLYHLGVSSRFKATTQQQNVVQQALDQLNEAQSRLRAAAATAPASPPPTTTSSGDTARSNEDSSNISNNNTTTITQPSPPLLRLESTAANLCTSVVEGLRLMTYSRAIIMGDRQRVGFGGTSPSLKRYLFSKQNE
jgi:hypothetical protein